MKKNLRIIFLCLIITFLQACKPLSENSSLPIQETATASVVEKPTPTFPASIATSTIPVMIPILNKKEAEVQMLTLLKENGECHLPCWWNVSPGESSITQFKEKLAPMSAIIHMLSSFPITFSDRAFIASGMKADLQVKDNILDLSINWYAPENQDTIELMNIKSAAYKLENGIYKNMFNSEFYHEYFKRYEISQILVDLGKPSKVLVFAEVYNPNPNVNPETLQVWLLYPEKGVFARYDMPLSRIGTFGQGCPSESFVSLWLTPPDINGFYTEIIPYLDGYSSFSNHKTIEDATTMSLEKFYITYNAPNNDCIKTPLSIWPTH